MMENNEKERKSITKDDKRITATKYLQNKDSKASILKSFPFDKKEGMQSFHGLENLKTTKSY